MAKTLRKERQYQMHPRHSHGFRFLNPYVHVLDRSSGPKGNPLRNLGSIKMIYTEENRQAQSYPQRCYGLTYVTLPGLMGSHSRVIRFAPHDGAKFMSPRFHRGNCRGVFMCAAYIAVFVWSFRPLVDPGFRPGPAYDALLGLRRMSPFPDSVRTQIISIFQSLVQ